MVLLAAIATIMLVLSEIAAIAPTPRAKRLRTALLWCAVPVLVLFAAAWLMRIQGMLSEAL